MKENNEKEKDEKSKEKRSGIITRESVGAVGALFSALAFIILVSRSLIFGNIGIAVNAFLLGLFGYCAYPLLIALVYLSVTMFIGKRFVRNRKAAAMISAALVCMMLIIHTAVTYSWDLSGYLSRCFKAPGLGEHGIDTAAPAGWTGGLIVYIFAKMTTKVGALVIFSLIFLFCAYLSVYFFAGKTLFRRPEKKNAAAKTGPAVSQAPARPVAVPPAAEPYACRDAAIAADGYGTPPASRPDFVPPYPDYAAAPQIRQRPGVALSNDHALGGQAGTVRGTSGAFSPFGASGAGERNGSGLGGLNMQSGTDPSSPAYREYQRSKEFLFGGTPAEIYRKNLIFDSNSNVNKRPPADPDQPTVYSGSFADSYSAAYADSVNGGAEPPRPAKIVTDNARGHDLYTPYTLHESDSEPGFGGARGNYPESPNSYEPVSPMPPFTPAPEVPIFRAEPVQTPAVHIPTPEPPPVERDRAEPVSPMPPMPSYGEGAEGRERLSPSEERPAESESSQRTRPSFMDIFSASNPNIYGQQRGEAEAGRIFADREAPRDMFPGNSERDAAEGRDSFGENEEELCGERDSENKINIFDEEEKPAEDPYTLRSDFSDSRRDRLSEPSESDASSVRGIPAERSSRMDLERGTRSDRGDIFPSERRGEAFEDARPVPAPPPKPRVRKPYQPAPLDYFDCRDVEPDANAEEAEHTKITILETLEAFKVSDSTIASVTYGPTVTRYNVVIPRNVSAKKVVALDQEIAMNLYASKGVNIYPNFEDGAVSIEVPNKRRQFVQLGCMLTGDGFVKSKPTSLVFAMGKDVGNRKIYGDICKMTHLLVAGASGSGKSVFLRTLIISLIVKYSPQELRLILIDPKKTEFVIYDHLPHLMINEIITDINKVIQSLNWAIGEMNRRYGLFEQMSRSGTYVVNIDEYNANLSAGEEKLPKIVIIVDELADLMLAAKKEVEDRIQNLTQKSRAAGIHLIIATQRPSADVITGVIKGNLPTRIAFSVASDVDSRVILDASGAQKLLGLGDLLYLMAGMNTPMRVQGASISSEDAQKVVSFIKANNEAEYDESASAYINNAKTQEEPEETEDDSVEEVYIDALRYIIQSGSASISMIQRKCSVGYNKAGKIIEWMEDMGYISAFDGAKARKVLITKDEFEQKYGPL